MTDEFTEPDSHWPEPPAWATAVPAEPFRYSDDVTEIIPALCAAQTALANITKNTEGQVGTRTYGYADLGAVMHTVRPALAEQGLLVMQGTTVGPDDIEIATRIWHTSAQWIEGRVVMPVEESTAQKVGSAITYGRRYGVSALLALATDTDDDGNAASQPGEGGPRQRNSRQAPPPAMPTIRTNDDGQPLVDLEVHRNLMDIAATMTPEQRTEMTQWRTANGIHNMTARVLTAADAKRVMDHIAEQQGDKDPGAAAETPTGDETTDAPTAEPGEGEAAEPAAGDAETPRAKRATKAKADVAEQAAAAQGATEPAPATEGGADPERPFTEE